MGREMTTDQQLEFLCKGAAEVINVEELRSKLLPGQPLTVKVGFDPTAPDLHLGHAVLLRKMKHFQDLGHRVIFLIGDFTGRIGDPTGRNKTRPPMTNEEIAANALTYKQQVFKILDAEKTVVDFNSRWLGAMTSEQWVHLCAKYTVARMLEREDFAKRIAAELPVSIHELLYPLAQAYDSVFLKADVELGGTDQRFNLLVGRDIQREYGQSPQVLLMTPILEGLDGIEKMSKSLGNYVGINEAPEQIFGKLMSITDDLMWRYYELLSDLSTSQIEELKTRVEDGRLHPMQAKSDLAFRIVTDFHSEAQAEEAREHFQRVFQERKDPETMMEFKVSGGPRSLVDVMTQAGMAESKAQARRLIQQGGVSIDGTKISDPALMLSLESASGIVLRVGKLKFCRIVPA